MVYGLRVGRGSEDAANQTNKLARRPFTSVLLEELGNVEFGDATVTGSRPLIPHQKEEAIRRRDEGESVRAIARTYNVSASTISRLTA